MSVVTHNDDWENTFFCTYCGHRDTFDVPTGTSDVFAHCLMCSQGRLFTYEIL